MVQAQDFDAIKRAAEKGDAEAQYSLGIMYAEGRGVARNDAEATKWFRMAAKKGHYDVLKGALVFGAICLVLGFWGVKKNRRFKMRYKSQTAGVVIEVQRHRSVGRYASACFPVFSYVVDGISYRKRFAIGTRESFFTEGQQVTVFYDPDDCYVEQGGYVYYVFLVLGVLLLIFALFEIILVRYAQS